MYKTFEEINEGDLKNIEAELPELNLIENESSRRKAALVWASFLKESKYNFIKEAPAFPGLPAYDLATHTRHVVKNSMLMGDTCKEFWGMDYDREELIIAALMHDASKLVEYEGASGEPSRVGETFLHAQLAGVRCLDAGLSHKVAYLVTYHPYSPPHVHIKPKFLEMVILSWADLLAADPIFYVEGLPTHLEFEKRFFQI